ncbi:hypothetical protein K466DRAFT_215486 [Polyporus arcularius HHB13444]|uniref:Uncharacterized protein n=1 Tax=Polyporus arcularius HHB13444 TaxID=1314778 RepID=A0A5C3P839_9APHY|nr:hypothetical protein K466DRAFT_215486 [Polyporus arcularius HHB13444]
MSSSSHEMAVSGHDGTQVRRTPWRGKKLLTGYAGTRVASPSASVLRVVFRHPIARSSTRPSRVSRKGCSRPRPQNGHHQTASSIFDVSCTYPPASLSASPVVAVGVGREGSRIFITATSCARPQMHTLATTSLCRSLSGLVSGSYGTRNACAVRRVVRLGLNTAGNPDFFTASTRYRRPCLLCRRDTGLAQPILIRNYSRLIPGLHSCP